MPLIEVKLYDTRIDEETVPKLIEKLTDALVDCTTEAIREHTWVLVEGLPAKQWGIGGKPGG
jgi:4-oxalocrotonate tautomerase